MNIRFLTLAFFTTILFSFSSQAQQAEAIISQQDWISRQQQQKAEDNKRLRQKAAINKAKDTQENSTTEEKNPLPTSEECFPLKKINLVEANSISPRQQKKLTAPFIGQCYGNKVLNDIATALKNYYDEQDYSLGHITVTKHDPQNGELELKVSEQKISEIIIGKNGFTDKMQKFTAFGNIEGKAINFHDIEQGIYQINRLSSNNASVDLYADDKDDTVKVYVKNKPQFPAYAAIGYDSLGNDYTGVRRTTFSGGVNNLLFLNDALNLSYTANLNGDRDLKNNKSFSSDFSIPFGYNTFSYDYYRSEFMRLESTKESSGYTESNTFTLDRVLFLKDNWRISSNVSLVTKSAASYLDHHKIALSKRNLTIGNIGFEIYNEFKNDITIDIKPTYSKGLRILNAKKDEQDLSSDSPRAQFERFELYATISKRLTIPKVDVPVVLTTEMDSQLSNDVLYGSEQFAVGGYYSVRGFRDTYLVGDSGYYFRNSANFNVGSLILPLINQKNLGILNDLNNFRIEPFYDYGYIHNKYRDTGGRLAGTGLKTSFDSNYFTASLTYSVATNRSQMLPNDKKENKMIYFEISFSCCQVNS